MPLQISLVHQFDQQKQETLQLAFSQDGKRLVSSEGTALHLWRLHGEGNWIYEHSLPVRGAGVLRFGPDVLFFVERGVVKLISFEGKEIATFPCPASRCWQITPSLRWVVSNENGRTLRLWDLTSHQSFLVPLSFAAGDRSGKNTDLSNECALRFLFTPDSHQVVLFASSTEGDLQICAFEPEHRRIILQKTLPGMIDGIISPDGKKLAIILPNGQIYGYKEEIYLYDLEALQLLHVFPQTTDERYCLLAFSPDSRHLASCKTDGWVDIFSLDSLDCVAQFAAHPGLFSDANDPIGGLDWSKTGYIATGGANVFEHDMKKTDYSIKLWKVEYE